MKTERDVIKNRYGLKLVIQIDEPEKPHNLAFVAHGRGGFKEQKHIQAFTDAFLENNFRVVKYDATHALGESDGEDNAVTHTTYLQDLEDVIAWARKQPWFKQPFALCGHSMGGMITALYAETHPNEVLSVAPISAVINYQLYKSTLSPEYMHDWETKGFITERSRSKPWLTMKVGWKWMEDLKKYDLLKNAGKLSMPVLLMVGEFDEGTPYGHQQKLYDAIPGHNKKIMKIANADHSFRGSNYKHNLEEVKSHISDWLRDINRLAP